MGKQRFLTIAANDSTSQHKNAANFICDGANDEVQINAALSEYPRIILYGGNYIIGAKISLPSNTCIKSDGSVTLSLSNNADCNIMENSDMSNGNNNVTLMGFTLDGNRDNMTSDLPTYASNGLWLEKVSGLKMVNLNSNNGLDYCIYMETCNNITVNNVHCDTSGRDGWPIDTCNNGTFTNISSNNTTGDRHTACNGFEIENGCSNLTFTTISAVNNYAGGVVTKTHAGYDRNSNIVFNDITTSGNTQYGCVFGHVNGLTVNGMQLSEEVAGGMYMTSVTGASVNDFVISAYGKVFCLQYGIDVTLSNGTVTGSRYPAMLGHGLQNLLIENVDLLQNYAAVNALQISNGVTITNFQWNGGSIKLREVGHNYEPLRIGDDCTVSQMVFSNMQIRCQNADRNNLTLVDIGLNVSNIEFDTVDFSYDILPANGVVYQEGGNSNITFNNCTGL